MTYHLRADVVTVDKAGLPYWATLCGVRMDGRPVGITDNKDDVTCSKCKAKEAIR